MLLGDRIVSMSESVLEILYIYENVILAIKLIPVGITSTCPQGPWKGAGKVKRGRKRAMKENIHVQLTSPGYPYSSSTPCDFVLQAEEGKRVEITVILKITVNI